MIYKSTLIVLLLVAGNITAMESGHDHHGHETKCGRSPSACACHHHDHDHEHHDHDHEEPDFSAPPSKNCAAEKTQLPSIPGVLKADGDGFHDHYQKGPESSHPTALLSGSSAEMKSLNILPQSASDVFRGDVSREAGSSLSIETGKGNEKNDFNFTAKTVETAVPFAVSSRESTQPLEAETVYQETKTIDFGNASVHPIQEPVTPPLKMIRKKIIDVDGSTDCEFENTDEEDVDEEEKDEKDDESIRDKNSRLFLKKLNKKRRKQQRNSLA